MMQYPYSDWSYQSKFFIKHCCLSRIRWLSFLIRYCFPPFLSPSSFFFPLLSIYFYFHGSFYLYIDTFYIFSNSFFIVLLHFLLIIYSSTIHFTFLYYVCNILSATAGKMSTTSDIHCICLWYVYVEYFISIAKHISCFISIMSLKGRGDIFESEIMYSF